MLIYILKFSACLAIFMAFYNLFLEKTSIHNFKRFYLLIIVVLALGIPLITFIQYVEPVVNTATFKEIPQINSELQAIYQPTLLDYLPQILWSIYGLGVLVFGINFLRNLAQIISKIKQNPKHRIGSFTNVLVLDLIIPHTFFNYIFLNKIKYETQQIPEEVLLHEKTHATQKHSLDVLFIELLQIVFWFNPLIYFIKHSIKLNHEFLADQAVLKQGIQPSSYQHILLAFSSDALEPKLANAINYSSIKKRFTVMKTHTSKQKIWLRSLLLLPLIALMLYGFSETKVVEKPIIQTTSLSQTTQKVIDSNPEKDAYYKNVTFQFRDKNKKIISTKKYSELTEAEKKSLILPPSKPDKKTPSQSEFNSWKDSKIYGIWLDEKRISNNLLNTYQPQDFSLYYVSKLEKNAVNYGKHYYQIGLYTDTYYEQLYGKGVQPLSEGVIISITVNDSTQTSATTEEVEEYNKLAKQYNAQPENERVVKLKDLKRLEYLFNKMSKEQKVVAEPFPNCPPSPPPAPDAPKVMKGNNVPPPPPIPANATPEQKNKMQEVIDNYNTQIPPPPPPPKSPLDFVMDISKENAKFFYKGNEISSEKAIETVKKNPKININAQKSGSEQPQVYLSEKPITINTQGKSDEVVMINGKTAKDNRIQLTKNELFNAKLTIKNGEIVKFIFKIPGVNTEPISGNTLNSKAKSNLENVANNTAIQLFMIKDSNNNVHPPILISIIE